MNNCEIWRGFDVPPEGYKPDNERKPVVDQNSVHNLNSQIIKVIASGNSLVPIPPPPSGTPPITSFVYTYISTSGQYFGCQVTRQQRSDNNVSSISINVRLYTGPVYDDKVNRLT